MRHKPYFKPQGGPGPLHMVCQRTIRLDEVDVLGIVWHGRYPSFLEDGREEMGRLFGLSYLDFKQAGVLLPIRILHLDYLLPLQYREKITIETTMHWHPAARLNMEYRILNEQGLEATKGYTVQLMVDMDKNLLLEAPEFFKKFQKKWQEGFFS